MLDIVNHLHGVERPDLNFVQLVGMPINASIRKNPLVQRLAEKFDANFVSLPLPLYAKNKDFVQKSQAEPFYQLAKEYYQNLDLVISGIGTPEALEDDCFLNKRYKSALFDNFYQQIDGFIFGRPYDFHGQIFQETVDHICGINEQDLRQVPIRLVVEKTALNLKPLPVL